MDLNTYVIKLDKNNHSQTKSQKYKIINCQYKITNNKDTTNWIKLNEIIKINDDLKIFKSDLFNK